MSIDSELLRKHIEAWKTKLATDPQRAARAMQERADRVAYYQGQTAEKIRNFNQDEFYEYISKLWAMLVWGNKKYPVDKLVNDNSFEAIKNELAELVWGSQPIESRWDHFRSVIKGMGPAMMSEILCYSSPDNYMLWNRRAYVGLHYLGIDDLPRYNYQVSGTRYRSLCDTAKAICQVMRNESISDANLLTLDLFIWDELQVEEVLSKRPVSPAFRYPTRFRHPCADRALPGPRRGSRAAVHGPA